MLSRFAVLSEVPRREAGCNCWEFEPVMHSEKAGPRIAEDPLETYAGEDEPFP